MAIIPIVIYSDNVAVVHVINKTTSKDTKLMHLMKRQMILSSSQNIHFRAEHIPSIANTAAGLISRLLFLEFITKFQHLINELNQLPQSLIKI